MFSMFPYASCIESKVKLGEQVNIIGSEVLKCSKAVEIKIVPNFHHQTLETGSYWPGPIASHRTFVSSVHFSP